VNSSRSDPNASGHQDEEGKPLIGDISKESLIRSQKRQKKSAVDEEKAEKDPFLVLGHGMYVYRFLMEAMIVCFLILSFFAYLTMSVYMQYDGIQNPQQFTGYSLANMGFTSAQC